MCIRDRPGPGQTGHGQVLHVDPLVIAGDAVGQLVMGVQAGVPDPAMLDSYSAYRLGASVRPLMEGAARSACRRPTARLVTVAVYASGVDEVSDAIICRVRSRIDIC